MFSVENRVVREFTDLAGLSEFLSILLSILIDQFQSESFNCKILWNHKTVKSLCYLRRTHCFHICPDVKWKKLACAQLLAITFETSFETLLKHWYHSLGQISTISVYYHLLPFETLQIKENFAALPLWFIYKWESQVYFLSFKKTSST